MTEKLTVRKLVLAMSLLTVGGQAMATNGYFTHGVGVRLKGMAGAGVGSNSDLGPIVVANNPALALFAADGNEFGLALFSPHRAYEASESLANGQGGAFTIGGGEVKSSSNLFPVPYFAKNWHLEDDRALTLMAYGRGGMNTDWDSSSATAIFDPDGPGPAPVSELQGTFGGGISGVDLSQLYISLNYASRYSENLVWGIGPTLAVQSFEVVGLSAFAPYTETFAAAGGTAFPDNLTNNGHDTSWGFGFTAGLWWGISDRWSFGLSYQSRIQMSEFGDYSDLFAGGGSFDTPPSTKAGLSYRADDNWRVNLDLEHTQFNEIESVGNPMALIAGCPTAGLGGTSLNNCLGGSNGAGFGWQDMTTYKIGAEWSRTDTLTLRFGYSYGEQPIRAQDALFNILAPGVMEQHFTFGATVDTASGNEWSAALMYAPEKEVVGDNLFDPTQRLTLKMYQFELELSYRF